MKNQNLKKVISAVICTALAASMMCSCGNESGTRKKNTTPVSTVNAVPDAADLGLDDLAKLTSTQELSYSITSSLAKSYKTVGDCNPISSNLFFADPTSVEYNGRLYVYGTCDTEQFIKNGKKGDNGYGGIDSLSCFSTDDMVNWTYHGDIKVNFLCSWAGVSWAPSIVSRPTESGETEFFLYFTLGGGGIGVIKANSPLGPWTDPLGHPLISGDTAELKDDPICWVFDPGVVIDDDGVGWIAFGGGDPQQPGETGMNTRNCRIARLGEDMVSLDSKIAVIEAPYHFEANELNYIDGKFYLTYCSNWQPREEWSDEYSPYEMPQMCTMCYMVSDDPLKTDSWEYKGEYLMNPTYYGLSFSNNHTHLQEFGGKYYLFYQNVSLLDNMHLNGASGYRSMNVDTLEVDTKKSEFKMGTMTSKGVEQLKKLDPFKTNEGETANVTAGIEYKKVSKSMAAIGSDGSWTVVCGADFGKDGAKLFAARVMGEGIIEIRLDDKDSAAVGAIQFSSAEDYSTVYCELSEAITGEHDVYLVFGGNEITLDQWQFK